MSKKIIISTILILSSVILLAQSQFATPNTLRVLTDANGSLILASAVQQTPISQPSVFSNTRLKTDANGSLLVIPLFTAGSGTQTYKPAGLLYAEYTNVANGADALFVGTTAYPLPANTLKTIGDTLTLDWFITLSSATSTKTFICNIGYTAFDTTGGFTGGASVLSFSSAVASQTFQGHEEIQYVSATAGDSWARAMYTTTPAFQASGTGGASVAWTASNNIKCISKDGSNNAAAVTLKSFRIGFQPAP